MSNKTKPNYDPVNNTYVNEAELQTKTDDEEWQDAYDMGFRPSDYSGKAKEEFEAFMIRSGL